MLPEDIQELIAKRAQVLEQFRLLESQPRDSSATPSSVEALRKRVAELVEEERVSKANLARMEKSVEELRALRDQLHRETVAQRDDSAAVKIVQAARQNCLETLLATQEAASEEEAEFWKALGIETQAQDRLQEQQEADKTRLTLPSELTKARRDLAEWEGEVSEKGPMTGSN